MTVISGEIVDKEGNEVVETPEELKLVTDKTALEKVLDAAKGAKEAVVISVDGTDVLTTAYWVTQVQMDSFTSAIAAAQAFYDADDADQSMITSARIALAAAATVFNGQKQPGTKTDDSGTTDPADKTLTGITLNTTSVKKVYAQNETLNLTGLVVTANYSDSTSATVSYTSTSPANGAALSSTGTITVTVSYTEGAITRTSGFTVTVIGTDGDTGTPGLTYQIINEGANANTLRVRKGTVTGGAVVIPAYLVWGSLGVMPVTEIGRVDDDYEYDNGAFSSTNITSITIPASVTTIGNSAFAGCTSLTSITIPVSVTTIGGSAFAGCTSLTSITVDANNPNYASQDGILYNKAKTELLLAPGGISGAVTIPVGVTSIGAGAFGYCAGLTSVTIPDSVTSIGGLAFGYCTGLTSITIPASVTSIHYMVPFAFCTSLTDITVNANNPSYASQNGILYNKAKTTLIQAPEGISGAVTIPANVTSIGNAAFIRCTGLTSVTIPASVTSIGNSAFADCTSLTGVTIPASVTSINEGVFNGCTSLTGVTIPEGVTSIGDSAFENCTTLTGITIPASVTSIGRMAFAFCTSLTGITVDANNPNYASQDGILYNKAKTTLIQAPGGISGAVTIPAGVTSISYYAFAGCTGLTSVTIPAGVTSIGDYAFRNCTSLTSVTFEGTISSSWNGFDGNAFYELGDLRDKFYQGDSANGIPGTYTRPDGDSTTWTKQP
jgi:hypothetical protein